ncbi:MAG: amidohydrolase [Chlamydiales bacterium]|nr:amidohydrolase [Chlamydiales bacterium]
MSTTSLKVKHLTSLAFDYQPYIQKIRRDLHQIPELAWEEVKTIHYLTQEITQLIKANKNPATDLAYSVLDGGIVVSITIDNDTGSNLFRADIDGLPIQEETGHSFSSTHNGKMHACGHDCHSAMLLGFLKIITDGAFTPSINLKLVWQRAEERSDLFSGVQSLIQEGVLQGVDKVYALHINSLLSHGTFFSKPGLYFSNSAYFNITIRCLGGHVMNPHKGTNSIEIAMDIHLALRGLNGRILNPNESVVFLPTLSIAGSARNVIPNEVMITYCLRNFLNQKTLHYFIETLKKKVEHIVAQHSATLSSFEFLPGYPMLKNNEAEYEKTRNLLQHHGFKTMLDNLQFAGEDFSFMLNERPGCYWIMGARNSTPYNHHCAKFNPDDSLLYKGSAFWLALSNNIPI